MKSGASASVDEVRKAHPQSNEALGEIEIYGELLRSVCSLGEILDTAGRIKDKSAHGATTTEKNPQSGCDVLLSEDLSRPDRNTPMQAETRVSTGEGTATCSNGPAWFRLGRFRNIAKQIAFAAVCTTAGAASAIAGFSIMRGDRVANFTVPQGRPDVPGRTGDLTAAPADPSREPVPTVVQSPSPAPASTAETAPHPNRGQPHRGESSEAAPKHEVPEDTKAPGGNMSPTLPARAHAAKTRKAGAPSRHPQARRSTRRQTPESYARPVYYQPLPAANNNFTLTRGYSYDGPAPYSDTGN
jgi:hypothetical protein